MRSISALVGALAYHVGLPVNPPGPPPDPIGEFLASLDAAPGHSESAADVDAAYRNWCLRTAREPVGARTLALALIQRLTVTRARQERRYVGIRIPVDRKAVS